MERCAGIMPQEEGSGEGYRSGRAWPRVIGNRSSDLLENKEPRQFPAIFQGPERDTDTFEKVATVIESFVAASAATMRRRNLQPEK